MKRIKLTKNHGFTLVELMIAISVFSVVIIIGFYAFIQINNYYTKGVNIVRTQDAARNLVADIATQLQLTSGTYTNQLTDGSELSQGVEIACVGNKAYVYQINVSQKDENEFAIYSYAIPINTCPNPLSAGSEDVTYLLKPGVRLLQLDIDADNAPLYNITVALLYAPEDGADNAARTELVNTHKDDPNLPGSEMDNIDKWNCNATVSGSQYCSLSRITTSVYKRIQ